MWRYLGGNEGCEGPRHVFSVDTETNRQPDLKDPFASREVLRLGVARYCRLDKGKPTCRREFAFKTADQFWGWVAGLAGPRSLNWIFAHSAGFDIRVLGWPEEVDQGRLLLGNPTPRGKQQAEAVKPQQPKGGVLVLDGPPLIVECWFPGGAKIRIVDSRNYWNTTLAEIGQEIGLDKLPMPEPWDCDQDWLEYCRRDCEILEAAILRLIEWHVEHDLGVFKPTLAGQAMQCFKHRFHSRKIVLHDDDECKRHERSGYFAGRLACFYVGEVSRSDKGVRGELFDKFSERAPRPVGPVHKLDVTSLFPSVMRGNLFPCKLLGRRFDKAAECAMPGNADIGIMATVRLNAIDHEYPKRFRGKVHYCRGRFETTLCGPELSRAFAAGEVESVSGWSAYAMADLFSSYVDYFWQLRYMALLAGRRIEAKTCKLMLNALYGKFGQRTHEWLSQPGLYPPEAWTNWTEWTKGGDAVRQYRSIGNMVQLRQERGDHPDSFAAISAWVTSLARCRMDQLRGIAGYHNVYYQAVDSLFVNDAGLERLQAASEVEECTLGKLRLEGSSDEAKFLGPGMYEFDGRWTRVSISRGAREVRLGEFEQDQFESFERSVSRPPEAGVQVKRVVRRTGESVPTAGLTANGWVIPTRGEACESLPKESESSLNLPQWSWERWLSAGSGWPTTTLATHGETRPTATASPPA